MKLRSVTLNDVRQFTSPVRVAGIGDGVNLLSAPNESGKSTLFDAIHAAFFIPHRSAKIKSLRPDVGGNPEIEVTLEDARGLLTLRKRWGRGPYAEVWRGGQLVAKADEAEAQIAALTQSPADGGPAGLLWVRQGITALDDTDKAAVKTRQDLLTSVTGEIAALTGGKRMDRALARAREELDRLVTLRGAKAGGPLDSAQKTVAALETRVTELTDKATKLRAALGERRAKRRELAELTDPQEVKTRTDRLTQADAAFKAADRHASQLQAAEAALKAADLALQAARREIDNRTRTAQAIETLTAQSSTAQSAAEAADARATEAQTALTKATDAHAAARKALREAEVQMQAALRIEARRAEVARHAQLSETLAQAETLAATLPALREAAATGPDARQLQALEDAAKALAIAEGLAQATAPHLTFTPLPGAPTVSLDGAPLDSTPHAITQAVTLDLPGLGTLSIAPGAGDAPDRLARAQDDLARALAQAGTDAPEAARRAARARGDAAQRLKEVQEALKRLAPEGIDALRGALARLAPQDVPEAPDLTTATDAVERARAAETAAELETARLRPACDTAREAAFGARHEIGALTRRLADARADLAEKPDAETLNQALTQADAQRQTAAQAHQALAAGAPDLTTSRAALSRAQSVVKAADDAINALNTALAGLDATVAHLSGEGVEEDLADATARLNAAQATRDAHEREVAVLRCLISALEAAQSAARDRYFEPVLTELRPMLRLLWPGAELSFDGDSLLPVELLRDGRIESIGTLFWRHARADLAAGPAGLCPAAGAQRSACAGDSGRRAGVHR
ncbi:AAA family ATPase [Pararhodobacter zhoushanensis]|uniref:AAA family ATPase n=1 Tax=Pararhodobacter zhoushanensis TaxID=2479545 RepID=A0ABT3GZ46_9RHOB|nr:AAA family ATPase [Pararhodobacter zhoushanensis]MCW1932745.1 AAA family ATPase [Pararhodobacter zhoushanensis]